jgi:hypothetical protein
MSEIEALPTDPLNAEAGAILRAVPSQLRVERWHGIETNFGGLGFHVSYWPEAGDGAQPEALVAVGAQTFDGQDIPVQYRVLKSKVTENTLSNPSELTSGTAFHPNGESQVTNIETLERLRELIESIGQQE